MAIASNIFWLRYSNRERTSSRRKLPTLGKARVFADGHSISVAGSDGCWPGCSTVAVRNCRAHRRSLGGLYQAWFTSTTSMKSTLPFSSNVDRRLDYDSLARRRPGRNRRHVNNSATAAARFPTQRARCSRAICDPMRGGGRWRAVVIAYMVWMESRINMKASIPSFFRWSRSSRQRWAVDSADPRAIAISNFSRSLSPFWHLWPRCIAGSPASRRGDFQIRNR